MKSRFRLTLVGGIIIALLAIFLMACDSGTDPVSGSGGGETWGITDFPDARTYTREIVNLPNPFVSWHGNTVNAQNWDLRREEIKQILQHYMFGYKHPDEGFTTEIVSVGTTSGGEQLITFKVTRDETADSAEFHAKVAVPSGTPPAGGWPVIMTVNSGAYNPSRDSASGNNGYINSAGFVHLNFYCTEICNGDLSGFGNTTWINAAFTSGVVPTLFPDVDYWSGTSWTNEDAYFERFDTRYGWITETGDPDAPGLMMNWIWGISRMIDALEAEIAKPADQRKISLDPAKIAITGVSRMGKLSMFAAAFEPRIAISGPADTCGAGFNIERFVSRAVNEDHSHRNFPHVVSTRWNSPERAAGWGSQQFGGNWPAYNMDKTEGFTPFDGYGQMNKLYTYLKYEGISAAGDNILYAREVTAAEALVDPTKDLDGGVTVAFPAPTNPSSAKETNWNFVIWMDDPAVTANVQLAGGTVDSAATNIKPGYGVHLNHSINDGLVEVPYSPQTTADMRWGFPNYWNERFQQFPLIFPDLAIHGRVTPKRGDWGYMANTPFDAHFISALIAPRPLVVFGGFTSPNANSEAAFFNYLATREVYSLLGAEDNIGIRISMHMHTQTAQEYRDFVDVCTAVWSGNAMPDKFRPDSVGEYPFAINDPRSRYDYVKLNWAAPGNTSIADQVKELVPADAVSWDQIGGIPNN